MIINLGGRTDIANYYTPWLLNRLNEGYVYSRNPLFKNNVSKLSLKPSDVDCLMFCSKNYSQILNDIDSINNNYHILCHYTITAYGKDIEPNVPSIEKSIDILKDLSEIIGSEKIIWRYDPILLTKVYTIEKIIETFDYISKEIAPYVQRCIFSFVDMYKKLEYNMPEIIPLTNQNKKIILKNIGEISKKYNLYTQTCATDEVYKNYGIHNAGCAVPEIFEKANNVKYKDNIKIKPMREGCHCIESRDIGAYDTCLSACKYCYANKNPNVAKKVAKLHDKNSPILIGHINESDKITEPKLKKYIIPNQTLLQL